MANGITEPNYMSRSEMLTKISSGIPGQTRQELEDLTKYIHEVDLEDQSLNQFNFGENADQRTESSGLGWHLFPEFESFLPFTITVEKDRSTPPVYSILSCKGQN